MDIDLGKGLEEQADTGLAEPADTGLAEQADTGLEGLVDSRLAERVGSVHLELARPGFRSGLHSAELSRELERGYQAEPMVASMWMVMSEVELGPLAA